MATANFYLKSGGDSSERLIYLFFSYNGNRLKYSTGQTINPDYWNEEKQRAKETRKFPQYPEFNGYLQHLENEAFNTYRRGLNNSQILTVDEFRAILDKYTGRAENTPRKGLFAFIEQFIQDRAASPKYAPGTIKIYRTALNHLKGFAKINRRRVDFDTVDLEFLQDFRDYLYSLNFAENYVLKLISTLRTFLNEATEKGLTENTKYKTRRLGVEKEPVQKIYLSLDELRTLFDLDISNPRLARVRDLFLIGAFTGLRFSDFTTIRPENLRTVDGVQIIELTTQKTGEAVTIPIHPFVRAILDRNGGQPPRGLSNQKMNDFLKELGELAGFDEPLIITQKRGGVKVSRAFRKYELLCTHTARRSFATNAYKEGISSIAIMKITGHRTESAFLRYIQITKEENALALAKTAFFNLSPLKAVK